MESSLAARMGLLSEGLRPFFFSVLAVLALHAGLGWGLWAHHLRQPTLALPQPMQVRLAEQTQSGGPQAMRKVLPDQRAGQAQAKIADAPISAPKVAPAAADARRLPAIPSVAQQVSLPPEVQPRPQVSNEPAPRAPTPAPAGNSPPASPTQANAHAAAPAAAAHTTPTSQGGSAAARADAEAQPAAKGPVDMPSASISYLVQPVLTFPPGSEELGESGSVTLRVLVDEKGVPSKVERLTSSGYPRLDQHAASVIRRARFVPHQVQGEPRPAWATVTLNFRLN
jgi:protein TonB